MSRAGQSELLRDLRERLRQIEQAHQPDREPLLGAAVACGLLPLPGNGLRWGTLTEWLSEEEGSGAATLALAVTALLVQSGGAVVVIDSQGDFYPPAAAGLGIPLEQTVIVRPGNERDVLWAWEQSLRSCAATVVLGQLRQLNDRAFRRLQLAAEAGGGLGFLLRPAACRAEPSWAAQRLLVEALPAPQPALRRRWRVELLSGRGGEAVELELSDEACAVRLASPLARPAPPAPDAGA